jgi:hypothetical protein
MRQVKAPEQVSNGQQRLRSAIAIIGWLRSAQASLNASSARNFVPLKSRLDGEAQINASVTGHSVRNDALYICGGNWLQKMVIEARRESSRLILLSTPTRGCDQEQRRAVGKFPNSPRDRIAVQHGHANVEDYDRRLEFGADNESFSAIGRCAYFMA